MNPPDRFRPPQPLSPHLCLGNASPVTSSSPAHRFQGRNNGCRGRVWLSCFSFPFSSWTSFTSMYVLSSQANPPPHEADVSKPRKLSKPRRPLTQEDAVMDPLAEALCVHRTWEDVTSGVAAQRPQAHAGCSQSRRSASSKQSWWKMAAHFLRHFRGTS